MITSSPLTSISDNVINTGKRSDGSLRMVTNEYKNFANALDANTAKVNRIPTPSDKTINSLKDINVLSTFGNIGGLLNSFLNKKLDVRGLIYGMFPGKGAKIGEYPKNDLNYQQPTSSGNSLKLTGTRALNLSNSIFSGLNYSTGLDFEKGVNKTTAAFSGSLSGSLLSGAIGKTLIPVTGLGFIIPNSVGLVISGGGGGYGPRSSLYEAKEFQEQKLAEGIRSPEKKGFDIQDGFQSILKNFSNPVDKFKGFVSDLLSGKINPFDTSMDDDQDPGGGQTPPPGDDDEVTVEGGTLPSTSITDHYGYSQWRGRVHQGVDYGFPLGTPISVIKGGEVVFSDWMDGYGNAIAIKHSNGVNSFYGHMQYPSPLKVGDKVEPGRVIGRVGSTGGSTGPHVHFEIRTGSGVGSPTAIEDKEGDKYFRLGGSVKVKPKENKNKPNPGNFNENDPYILELHADPYGASTTGRTTGLISYRPEENNKTSQDLIRKFGAYPPNFRMDENGGLGAQKRGARSLEVLINRELELNARDIIDAFKKDPTQEYYVLAGHERGNITGPLSGETGAKGEAEYVARLAKLVYELAKKEKLNVTLLHSALTKNPNDPRSSFSVINRSMVEGRNRKLSRLKPKPKPKPGNTSSYETVVANPVNTVMILPAPPAQPPVIAPRKPTPPPTPASMLLPRTGTSISKLMKYIANIRLSY